MGIIQDLRRAWAQHETEAWIAFDLFKGYLAFPIGEVAGCTTLPRLAVRIASGKTFEQAAASEYAYRWRLAIRSPVFGVPHTLGM